MEDDVDVILTSWMITDNSCLYPPKNVIATLKKKLKPGAGWTLHECRILGYYCKYKSHE